MRISTNWGKTYFYSCNPAVKHTRLLKWTSHAKHRGFLNRTFLSIHTVEDLIDGDFINIHIREAQHDSVPAFTIYYALGNKYETVVQICL